MMQPEKQLTEKESLDLIAQMINKAKDACHDTGVSAIMWGIVITVCSVVRLSELQFRYELPFDIYWLTLAAVIPQIYFSIKQKRERKVKVYGEAFFDYLWVAFGICMFLVSYSTGFIEDSLEQMIKQNATNVAQPSTFVFYEYISSFYLLLYGLPTFVSGVAMKFKPMLFGGLFCWICSIVTLYTPIKMDLILTGLSAIFAWLIPGIIMEKDYRKAKQGLAAANV